MYCQFSLGLVFLLCVEFEYLSWIGHSQAARVFECQIAMLFNLEQFSIQDANNFLYVILNL